MIATKVLKPKKLLIVTLIFICFCSSAKAKVALDPSVIGVGARALGMGRAYVAATGEPDSIFLNPASLTSLSHWGATSMYSKLMSEVDYLLLGASFPVGEGIAGLGYLNASISGLQKATRDPNTGIISFEAGTTNYYNSINYLTYAHKISKELALGTSFKFFQQGFSAGNSGQGFDLDLGITYQPFDFLTLGFLQRNFLPASLGAKIKWSNNEEESLVTSSRLGLSYQIALVNLNLDYELFPTSNKNPLLKLGAEWWLAPAFALRVGSDQDPLETNFTAGLSFLTSGFMFDYAYHQYGSLSTNTTHTFSLSYGIFKEKEEKEYLKVEAPLDQSLLFEEETTVEGSVLPEVSKVETIGKEVSIENRTFRFLQPLELGKNSISLTAFDKQGKKLEEKKIRVLRLKEFKDVPKDYWVRIPIAILAMEKIVSGYPDGTFRPEGNITRAEICTLLMKTKDLRPKTKDLKAKFKDVSEKHWAASYIEQAVKEGIVKGYPDKTFRPNGLITRAEGVAIITRFAQLPEANVLEAPFPDVPGRFWAAREILSAREAGMLKYLEGKNFEPQKKLTRAEVVEILSKTKIIKPKVDEMLNFEEGY